MSFEKREEVVSHWLQLGNINLTAAVCGVNKTTIKSWMKEPWWANMAEELTIEGRLTTNAKIRHVVQKSLNAMEDRLDNGELVLDQKTGEMVRRPVALRDATNAAVSLMQRQAAIEKLESEMTNVQATKTIHEQLALLANEFAKFNNRSKANAETIEFREVETDALHDQWEEGLQEGSGEVYEPSGSSEEEGGAEQGSPDDGEGGESPQG